MFSSPPSPPAKSISARNVLLGPSKKPPPAWLFGEPPSQTGAGRTTLPSIQEAGRAERPSHTMPAGRHHGGSSHTARSVVRTQPAGARLLVIVGAVQLPASWKRLCQSRGVPGQTQLIDGEVETKPSVVVLNAVSRAPSSRRPPGRWHGVPGWPDWRRQPRQRASPASVRQRELGEPDRRPLSGSRWHQSPFLTSFACAPVAALRCSRNSRREAPGSWASGEHHPGRRRLRGTIIRLCVIL